MKVCPTCNSAYSDDTLKFCLVDGSALRPENDPDATIVIQPPEPQNASVENLQPHQTMKPHVIYAVAGLVAVLLIIGASVMLRDAATKSERFDGSQSNNAAISPTAAFTPSPIIETREALVPAGEMWFDTGITLTKGAQLNIRASGEWSDGGTPLRFWGPNGTGDPWPGTIVPSADLDALVGRVGTTKFLVGENYFGRSPESGNLLLSINDVPGEFSTNKGAMKVEVSFSSH